MTNAQKADQFFGSIQSTTEVLELLESWLHENEADEAAALVREIREPMRDLETEQGVFG